MMSEIKNNKIKVLKEAAKTKHEVTLATVQLALSTMESKDMVINYSSVSKFSGVSRTWLYEHPEFSKTIKKLNDKTKKNTHLREQVTKIKKRDAKIAQLIDQNNAFRQQIDELKKQLEVSYAELYKRGD